MNQAWLVTGFFFALLLTILYGAFLILSPFLKAITWAAILAVLVYPAYTWLLARLEGRANAAALIIITLITLLVVLPGIRLGGYLSYEAVELVKTVRAALNGEGVEPWAGSPWMQRVIGWWGMLGLNEIGIEWKELVVKGVQSSSGALVTQLTGVAQNILLFLANFVIVLVTLFFFLRDGKALLYRIRRLLPMDPEHQERLIQNIANAVSAVVHGCIVVALIQGLLAGLAYWLLGVPYAIVWGVLTAFAALFPVGGTTLVTVPIVIYLFLSGETVRGFILLAWSVGVVGTVDNVLKPMFIGTRMKMPILFLFFGILGGIAVFGAIGVIVGPVVLALLAVLLDLYSEEYGARNTEFN